MALCAHRGLDQKLALIVVGVNPLWVIYGLGGAHNDLIMTLFLMGAVALTFVSEERKATAPGHAADGVSAGPVERSAAHGVGLRGEIKRAFQTGSRRETYAGAAVLVRR